MGGHARGGCSAAALALLCAVCQLVALGLATSERDDDDSGPGDAAPPPTMQEQVRSVPWQTRPALPASPPSSVQPYSVTGSGQLPMLLASCKVAAGLIASQASTLSTLSTRARTDRPPRGVAAGSCRCCWLRASPPV